MEFKQKIGKEIILKCHKCQNTQTVVSVFRDFITIVNNLNWQRKIIKNKEVLLCPKCKIPLM